MKPIHEQEWRSEESPGYGRMYVVADDNRMTCETRIEDGPAIANFISAAPDMARALLMMLKIAGEGAMLTQGERDVITAALRKAGVIPTQLPPASSDNQS